MACCFVEESEQGEQMKNQEFDDILASLQQIVRQAYTLGRSDALKQVVEVLKADAASAKPLALMGPAEEAGSDTAVPQVDSVAVRPEQATPEPFKASNDDHGTASSAEDPTPWYARQPRGMW